VGNDPPLQTNVLLRLCRAAILAGRSLPRHKLRRAYSFNVGLDNCKLIYVMGDVCALCRGWMYTPLQTPTCHLAGFRCGTCPASVRHIRRYLPAALLMMSFPAAVGEKALFLLELKTTIFKICPVPRSDSRPEAVFVAALICLSDACSLLKEYKVDTIFNQVVFQGQVLTPRPSHVGLRPPGNDRATA